MGAQIGELGRFHKARDPRMKLLLDSHGTEFQEATGIVASDGCLRGKIHLLMDGSGFNAETCRELRDRAPIHRPLRRITQPADQAHGKCHQKYWTEDDSLSLYTHGPIRTRRHDQFVRQRRGSNGDRPGERVPTVCLVEGAIELVLAKFAPKPGAPKMSESGDQLPGCLE